MTHRITGIFASTIFGLLWITFGVFIAFVIPNFGITSPLALSNPNILLPAIKQHPQILIFPGLDIALGVTIIFLSVAIAGKIKNKITASYGLPFGVVSGLFFILLATNRLVTLPLLAEVYETNTAMALDLFQLVNASHDGITMAIRIALSLWLFVMAIGIRSEPSGKALFISMTISSLVNAIGIIILPVSGLNILLFPILAGFLTQWFWKSTENI